MRDLGDQKSNIYIYCEKETMNGNIGRKLILLFLIGKKKELTNNEIMFIMTNIKNAKEGRVK